MKTGIALRILSFLRPPSLKPVWSFTASGVLWRLFPANSGELIGESRDQEKKVASFFAIDGKSGKCLWEGVKLDEPWWIGIEDVTAGVLLLHKFGSPDMPGHLGIIGVDLRQGNVIWTNNELTFWFAHEKSVFAQRMAFEKRKVYEIDALSGKVLREIQPEEESELLRRREEALRESGSDLLFPEKGELGRREPTISEILSRVTRTPPDVSGLEYLRVNDFVVLNYHVPSKERGPEQVQFDNHLCIYEMNRDRILYSDCISHNVPAIVPDSFFVRGGKVLYIKDQRTLTAVQLIEE